MPPDSTTCLNAYTNKYCTHFLLVLLASTKFTTKLVNILPLTTLILSLNFGFTASGVWSLLTHSGGQGGMPPGQQRHHCSQNCRAASWPDQLCPLFAYIHAHQHLEHKKHQQRKSPVSVHGSLEDTTCPLHCWWQSQTGACAVSMARGSERAAASAADLHIPPLGPDAAVNSILYIRKWKAECFKLH